MSVLALTKNEVAGSDQNSAPLYDQQELLDAFFPLPPCGELSDAESTGLRATVDLPPREGCDVLEMVELLFVLKHRYCLGAKDGFFDANAESGYRTCVFSRVFLHGLCTGSACSQFPQLSASLKALHAHRNIWVEIRKGAVWKCLQWVDEFAPFKHAAWFMYMEIPVAWCVTNVKGRTQGKYLCGEMPLICDVLSRLLCKPRVVVLAASEDVDQQNTLRNIDECMRRHDFQLDYVLRKPPRPVRDSSDKQQRKRLFLFYTTTIGNGHPIKTPCRST